MLHAHRLLPPFQVEAATFASAAAALASRSPCRFLSLPRAFLAAQLKDERSAFAALLAAMRETQCACFAALYHGPRAGAMNWSFARPLPRVRYLTNAYGLTPIRRRIIQYLVLPTAAARAFLRPRAAPLEVTGFSHTPLPYLQQKSYNFVISLTHFPTFLVVRVQMAATVEVAGGVKRKAEE